MKLLEFVECKYLGIERMCENWERKELKFSLKFFNSFWLQIYRQIYLKVVRSGLPRFSNGRNKEIFKFWIGQYLHIVVGVRIPVSIWVGYFEFLGILVYGYKTCSGIFVLRVKFEYLEFDKI